MSILEDPAGRRRRVVAVVGGTATMLFLCWLVAITLGGVGLSPLPNLPVPGLSKSDDGPDPLTRDEAHLAKAQPAPPATPPPVAISETSAGGGSASSGKDNGGSAGDRSTSSPVAGGRAPIRTPASQTGPGNSVNAPGQNRTQTTTTTTTTTTTPGASETAPGQSDNPPPGQSETGPGQSETAPGHSIDKPGHGPNLKP